MVDSHCHLADEAFVVDLETVVDRARAAGLTTALCILDPTVPDEMGRAERVFALWPEARSAVGVHPHHAAAFAGRVDAVDEVLAEALDGQPGVRAVGEIGLDYHYDFSPRAVQRELFARQVDVARRRDLPVVIHTREAEADTVAVLKEVGAGHVRGVFHCFTGDAAFATQAIDLGFHVSFSGIVTFHRADDVREAARLVPPDRLLVETDAPYLAPTPHRGQRNEPARVGRVIEGLADARGEPVAVVTQATTIAFERLFQPSSVPV